MTPEAAPLASNRLAREDDDRREAPRWQFDPLKWHSPAGKLARIRHEVQNSELVSALDSLGQEYESVWARVPVEPPLEEWADPGSDAVYHVRNDVVDSSGFGVVDRILRHNLLRRVERDIASRCKRDLNVLLTDAQAHFLAERAEATDSTPGAVLGEMISLVMQDDPTDGSQVDNQSVRTAFGDYANRYLEISNSLLESDPDLRTSVPLEALAVEATQAVSATYADETAEPAPELSDADLQQAFSEYANEYPAVCKRIFGEQAALSAHRRDQHIRAQAVLIPKQARTGERATTVADLIDRLEPSADNEPALRTYIVHLLVDTDEPLEGPAIIFPSSSH